MSPPRRGRGLGARLGRLRRGAENALALLREGRLGAPYRAPSEVVEETPTFTLRRYLGDEPPDRARYPSPALLVPPLMVTAEIYDISPELSAAAYLVDRGLDVWVCDFGAPEEVDGGLDRTLDDHVLAISRAVDRVSAETGGDVHLIGYSQGGMFCYQAAAYRRSAGIRSIVTFGAPVDLRRNLPVKVHDSLAERLIGVARRAIDAPLRELAALPGTLSSRGFKLMAPAQELKQLVATLGLLHDREALAAKEPKRRFLAGEGFIAWPGPAFRKFVDDFVVHNRMKDGGFVIAGRTVALADIRAPIACFIGLRDDLARPEAVRAIGKAAVNAACHPIELDAGHFGLVVGSTAMAHSWPTTAAWLAWVDGVGPRPDALDAPATGPPAPGDAPEPPAPDGVLRLYDIATEVLDGLWHRLGEVGIEASAVLGAIRWQLPRLARMASLAPHSRVSYARVLAEQADAIGDETFFVWRGRAFTYAEADARVEAVAAALHAEGVRRGHHVGVLMANHPDYLNAVGAINRLGAVSVLLPTESRGLSLRHGLDAGEVDHLVVDRGHLAPAREAFGPGLLIFDGAGLGALPEGVRDLTALAREAPALPEDLTVNDGRAGDLATLIFTSGTTGLPKAARITNGRWIAAGLGAATACELTPRDTVYCCLPLYHASGIMVAVGGALTGGARLALAPRFSASTFWPDVRNAGATVVFYVGEFMRYLVSQPPHPLDRTHPVRVFAGNGLAPDVWREVAARFGRARILEFYSATEGIVVLLNRTGDKIGSVGQALTEQVRLALVAYDVATETLVRGEGGRCVEVGVDEPGLLIAAITGGHPLADFAGYTDPAATEAKILRGVFEEGDAWFDTGDLLRRDADGDYFFVDRVGDTYRWKGENVATELVARVLRETGFIRAAAVYGVRVPGHEGRAGMAAVELEEGADFDPDRLWEAVHAHLGPAARPVFVRVVRRLERTPSLKVIKHALEAQGADPGRVSDPLWRYDAEAGTYAPLDLEG